ATGVLVAHAVTAETDTGAWLAVSWLPLAAKCLWLVHGLWERTALTATALDSIAGIQQEARDDAAVARARLRAEATTEATRLTAVTEAGARVARTQAKTAKRLSKAWSTLEKARADQEAGPALTSVTNRVTPGVTPLWELPVWGPSEPVPALESAPALSDEALANLVDQIRHSETPALSYREMATRFRAAGHSASEVRLRAAWKRVVAA
ncbi:protein spdB, partial [Streptomyces fungicidicus]